MTAPESSAAGAAAVRFFFNLLKSKDKKEKSLFLIFPLTARVFLGSMHFCRGAVAQLGERLNGIQEVRSSILLSSTKKEIRVCGNADPFFVSGAGTQTAKAGALTSPGFFRIRLEV